MTATFSHLWAATRSAARDRRHGPRDLVGVHVHEVEGGEIGVVDLDAADVKVDPHDTHPDVSCRSPCPSGCDLMPGSSAAGSEKSLKRHRESRGNEACQILARARKSRRRGRFRAVAAHMRRNCRDGVAYRFTMLLEAAAP